MRKAIVLLIAAVLVACVTGVLAADKYPTKPVTYVIPFAAGGESDITARLQQGYLDDIFGQKFLIVNKPAGGGALGWAECADGRPDGYTITGVNLPHTIVQPMERNDTGYKTDELQVVYYFQSTPNVIMVAKDSPFKTLADLVKFAKANPGVVTVGGSATNSANHLGVMELEKAAGIKLTYIPFSGSGSAVPALLGRHVSALMSYTTMGVNYTKDSRILAIATEERAPYLPDVPTFRELGYDVVEGAYRGIAVPPGTPADIMKALEAAFSKINHDPAYIKKMEDMGFQMENYGIEASKKLVAEKKKYYAELLKDLLAKK